MGGDNGNAQSALTSNPMEPNKDAKETPGKTYWMQLHDLIPTDMSKDEYTIYIVIFVIILIALCVVCFVCKKILLFGIIIAVFVALAWWYMYIYRNQT